MRHEGLPIDLQGIAPPRARPAADALGDLASVPSEECEPLLDLGDGCRLTLERARHGCQSLDQLSVARRARSWALLSADVR
jgi:hypothetical protein